MDNPITDKRPGGAMARRELHFIWLLDTSGSMNVDGKIQALNVGIHETIPVLQAAARSNPNVDLKVRALTFSSGARWHIETPTPVTDLRWDNLTASGYTDLGQGLRMLADVLKTPPMPERAVSPMLVLVTDGYPTDDFEGGLAALKAERWGAQALRRAIAIGRDAAYAPLVKFIGDDSVPPLSANNPEALVQQIRWVSRTGVESASKILDPNQRRAEEEAQRASLVSSYSVGDEW